MKHTEGVKSPKFLSLICFSHIVLVVAFLVQDISLRAQIHKVPFAWTSHLLTFPSPIWSSHFVRIFFLECRSAPARSPLIISLTLFSSYCLQTFYQLIQRHKFIVPHFWPRSFPNLSQSCHLEFFCLCVNYTTFSIHPLRLILNHTYPRSLSHILPTATLIPSAQFHNMLNFTQTMVESFVYSLQFSNLAFPKVSFRNIRPMRFQSSKELQLYG